MNCSPRWRFAPTLVITVLAFAAGFTGGCSHYPSEEVAEPVITAPRPKPMPPPIDKPMLEHKVVSGDSLWKLARDYDTNIAEIKQANKLESDLIKTGDTLKIPTLKRPPAVGATTAAVTGSVTPGRGTQVIEDAPASPPSELTLGEDPPSKPEKNKIPDDVPFYRDASRRTPTVSDIPPRDLDVPSIVP